MNKHDEYLRDINEFLKFHLYYNLENVVNHEKFDVALNGILSRFNVGERLWLLHVTDSMVEHLSEETLVTSRQDIYQSVFVLFKLLIGNQQFIKDQEHFDYTQRSQKPSQLKNSSESNGDGGKEDDYSPFQIINNNDKSILFPIKTRLKPIYSLLDRDINLTSISSVKDDRKLLRLLVGKLTNLKEENKCHILTLKDNTGEIIVQFDQQSDVPIHYMDSIVFVPYFNVICPDTVEDEENINLKDSSNLLSRFSHSLLQIEQLNYLEVKKLYSLFRDSQHYYECIKRIVKNHQPKTDIDSFLLQMEHQTPIQEILDLNPDTHSTNNNNNNNNSSNKLVSIGGFIKSKSAIIHSKFLRTKDSELDTFFFIQLAHDLDQSPYINVIFFRDTLRYFEFIRVGNYYLMNNLLVGHFFQGTPQTKSILITMTNSKIFRIESKEKEFPCVVHPQNSNGSASSQSLLGKTVNYQCKITSELDQHTATIEIEGSGLLFLSHYKSYLYRGRGLRYGNTVKLENVHSIYENNQLIGFGMCQYSSVTIISFDNRILNRFRPLVQEDTLMVEDDYKYDYSKLWSEYSISDSYYLSKILKRLQKRFHLDFPTFKSFQVPFSNHSIPLYQHIGRLFNIHRLVIKEDYYDRYDHILSHDTNCILNCNHHIYPSGSSSHLQEKRVIPKLVCVSKLLTFNGFSVSCVVGKLQITTQRSEYGRVILQDDSGSFDAFISDLNQHHLYKIWRINNYMFVKEEYLDQTNHFQSINYMKFSIMDCDLISLQYRQPSDSQYPVLDSSKLVLTPIDHLGLDNNLIIQLISKTIETDQLLVLKGILINDPSLPLVTVKTTPFFKHFYPVLQFMDYYHISHATSVATLDDSIEFRLSIISMVKRVDIKPVNFEDSMVIDTDDSIRPEMPIIEINYKLYQQLESTSLQYRIENIHDRVTIGQLYKEGEVQEDHYNNMERTLSVKVLVYSKSIISIKGIFYLLLMCIDPSYTKKKVSLRSDTSIQPIIIIVDNYYFGIDFGCVIDFYHLQYLNYVNSTLDPLFKPLLFQPTSKPLITLEYSKNSYFVVDSDSAKIELGLISSQTEKLKQLSDITISSPQHFYKVISDFHSIRSIEFSYTCKKCNGDLSKCDCEELVLGDLQLHGFIECQVTDQQNSNLQKTIINTKPANLTTLLGRDIMDAIKKNAYMDRSSYIYQISDSPQQVSSIQNDVLESPRKQIPIDKEQISKIEQLLKHNWKKLHFIVRKLDLNATRLLCESIFINR
ncbi:hypothetical protein DLAC_01320 [Tieghemostelium lacteum]|uniref:Uncharacterized protein n=1 Tax=Tieghemostelium lacteum TaxID=361077 RepID=A0A152A8A8_TIELA|nr:hypothetical protein DLAC_01320 [Tieghemostelium lacteum]|eukprot:KYR02480.1 hypothetical protein DLAC_01320 [Tieghemostelium lacteum]